MHQRSVAAALQAEHQTLATAAFIGQKWLKMLTNARVYIPESHRSNSIRA
jgi:hypothetical protein